MWLRGVTISTTDESNGKMSLTLLPLPASKKERLPGLFFPPPDGTALDPCSAEPWARSTGLGWCSLRNCSGFLSLVVQFRGCHGLQEWKPAPANLPSLLPPESVHPESPHPIPWWWICCTLHPPAGPETHLEPETVGRNWDLASRKPEQKQKAPPCKVLHSPSTAQPVSTQLSSRWAQVSMQKWIFKKLGKAYPCASS